MAFSTLKVSTGRAARATALPSLLSRSSSSVDMKAGMSTIFRSPLPEDTPAQTTEFSNVSVDGPGSYLGSHLVGPEGRIRTGLARWFPHVRAT